MQEEFMVTCLTLGLTTTILLSLIKAEYGWLRIQIHGLEQHYQSLSNK